MSYIEKGKEKRKGASSISVDTGDIIKNVLHASPSEFISTERLFTGIFDIELNKVDTILALHVRGQKNKCVSFEDSSRASYNLETLLAVSACLQGTRVSTSDESSLLQTTQPIDYDPKLKNDLRAFIRVASERIKLDVDSPHEKDSFYSHLASIVCRAINSNPDAAYRYCSGENEHESGFGIFNAFFPDFYQYTNLIEKLRTETLTKNQLYEAREFIRRSKPEELSDELKYILEELLDISEYKYPTPQEFGLTSNPLETEMMREFYPGNEESDVLSPDEIRKHPQDFLRFQQKLVETIATKQGISFDLEEEIPYPTDHPKRHDEKSFRDLEQHLKRTSEWLWLLLYPTVWAEYVERMPYTRVPPYVVIDGEAIPVTAKGKNGDRILQYFKDESLTPFEDLVVNELKFLNFVKVRESVGKNNEDTIIESRSTVPGVLIRKIIEAGGFPILDHGITRYVVGEWRSSFPIDQGGYIFSEPYFATPPSIDIDMLVFHMRGKHLSELAQEITEGTTMISSFLLGRSMLGVPWTFISKSESSGSRELNPYVMAHDPKCMVQALEAWQAGNLRSQTDMPIEAFIGFSSLRSIMMTPKVVHDEEGQQSIAVKIIDPFGGILAYSEGGGGTVIDGVKKNLILFPYIERAFPENTPYAVWHVLRSLDELFFMTGGAVLFGGEVLKDSYGANADTTKIIEAGVNQMRQQVIKAAQYLRKLQSGEKIIAEAILTDLRIELERNAKGMIDKDICKFLLMCSGENDKDPSEHLAGLELSLFYPHLHSLRMQPELWKKIIDKINQTKRSEDESPLVHLAKVVLEIPEALPLISNCIEKEFLIHPKEVGEKLAEKKKYWLDELKAEGFLKNADWMVLALNGIGSFATHSQPWASVLQILRDSRKIREEIMNKPNWESANEYLLKVRGVHFPADKGLNMKLKPIRPEWTYSEKHGNYRRERQIAALADWLLAPGY